MNAPKKVIVRKVTCITVACDEGRYDLASGQVETRLVPTVQLDWRTRVHLAREKQRQARREAEAWLDKVQDE